MNRIYLDRIVIKLPKKEDEFTNLFLNWFKVLGKIENNTLKLNTSSLMFYPKIFVDFNFGHSTILTQFSFSNGESFSVNIENITGQNIQSPHSYQYVRIDQVIQRLMDSGIQLINIDHLGFNLPWFASELHPNIFNLRTKLSSYCLYHKFPTGEPWDFIIPGDIEEIDCSKPVDYSTVRKPKFEIVSFPKASKPLIQFDLGLETCFEDLLALFPEALVDPELRNLWIYLVNPYDLDVCLVLNEFNESDWSDFFEGSRI